MITARGSRVSASAGLFRAPSRILIIPARRMRMHIKSGDFRVREGDEVDLKKWPTLVAPVYKSNEQYQDLLGKHVEGLSAQQELLYASNTYAVLLIFQAMDAAGKDGADG